MKCPNTTVLTFLEELDCFKVLERNGGFATNSVLIIFLSLQPDVEDLRLFKLSFLSAQII